MPLILINTYFELWCIIEIYMFSALYFNAVSSKKEFYQLVRASVQSNTSKHENDGLDNNLQLREEFYFCKVRIFVIFFRSN